jgi:hypothetical protein
MAPQWRRGEVDPDQVAPDQLLLGRRRKGSGKMSCLTHQWMNQGDYTRLLGRRREQGANNSAAAAEEEGVRRKWKGFVNDPGMSESVSELESG